MLSRNKISTIFILALLFSQNNGAKFRVAYFLKNDISFNTLYIQDHYMEIAPNRLTLNVTLNLVDDFPSDPWVEIKLAVREQKNGKYRSIFQYDVNVCSILGKINSNQMNGFIFAWINNVWKYGNLPKTCPIKKDNYNFINLRPEKFNIPPFIPVGRYLGIINSYFQEGDSKISLTNCTMHVDIK